MKRIIVQVVQHLLPGGIEMLALELQRCASKNDEVHIVSLEGSLSNSTANWPVIAKRKSRVHFLSKEPGLSPNAFWKLYRLLKKLNPSVVHTHHIGPLIYGGLAARFAGIPTVIHTEHDAWHLLNERRQKVEKLALSLVKPKVVADACIVRRMMLECLGNVNPEVIHNGVDIHRFSPGSKHDARERMKLPYDVKIVGCAARLSEEKGHEILLDAFYRLPCDVHLALAGDGPLRDHLKQQANELGIKNRVHFLGRVDDMPEFYRAIDVFCLASLNEGLPISPLEAQACGVPVVMTDVGASREALCQETGLLVEPNDSRALARSLKRQLNSRVSTSPRAFVVSGKSIEVMVSAYNELAERALA